MVGVHAFSFAFAASILGGPLMSSPLRPQSARLQRAIEWSLQESATFRSLADTLAERDVIVWIEAGACYHGRHPACLQHRVTIAGSHRFLFVFVLDDLPQLRVAEFVAHELQHAIEVADAGITRADDFEPLYERIGEPCEYQHYQQCRETVAAIAVQNRVMRELAEAGRRTVR